MPAPGGTFARAAHRTVGRAGYLVIKVRVTRDAAGGWPPALTPDQLRQAVEDNLVNAPVELDGIAG